MDRREVLGRAEGSGWFGAGPLRRTQLVAMGGAWAGTARVSSRVVLSSVGELVVGVSDKFPERDWNADSWEEVSK